MRKSILFIIILFSYLSNASEKTPKDVSLFIKKREHCDTLRGEEPPTLKQDLDNWIANTNRACKGLDKSLRKLKLKYNKNKEVTDIIIKYEELDVAK